MRWTVKDLGAIGVFCVLLVVHVWPVALAPATASFDYNDDGLFHVWLVTSIVRQLTTAPMRLHDVNIYYPEENSLRYADSTIFPAAVAVPAWLLSGDPQLTHNVAWLLGFLLTGLGMYALVRSLTSDRFAALLAAVLFAFNPHVATRYPHIMATHLVWLAVACLALERMRSNDAWRWPVLLGLAVVGSGATSGYQGVLVVILVGTLWLARAPEIIAAPARFLSRASVAIAAAAAAGWPLLAPWMTNDGTQPVQSYANLASYVATTSHIHWFWSRWLFELGAGVTFFPGFVAVGLAAYGLWCECRHDRRRRETVIGYAALCLVGLLMSLELPLFDLLKIVFPPAGAMREVGRFGVLYLTGLAVMAGLGMAAVRRWYPGLRGELIAIGMIAVVSVELYTPPRVVPRRVPPAVYERVARLPETTVLLEIPFYPNGPYFARNAQYVWASMRHWYPLVNGYGSVLPAGYRERASRLRRFPDNRSLRLLDELAVTAVLVHADQMPAATADAMLAALQEHRRFRLLRNDGEGRYLFRYRPRAARPRLAPGASE